MDPEEWRGLSQDLTNCLVQRNAELDRLRAELAKWKEAHYLICQQTEKAEADLIEMKAQRDKWMEYSCGDRAELALRTEKTERQAKVMLEFIDSKNLRNEYADYLCVSVGLSHLLKEKK